MTIEIISIDHYLQYVEDGRDADPLRRSKERLATMLRARFESGSVTAVFEESSPKKLSIAQKLVGEMSQPIPWHNILMTEEERRAAGIYEALQNRPGAPNLEDMTYWIEYRIPEDDIREDYFVARVEAEAPAGERS